MCVKWEYIYLYIYCKLWIVVFLVWFKFKDWKFSKDSKRYIKIEKEIFEVIILMF